MSCIDPNTTPLSILKGADHESSNSHDDHPCESKSLGVSFIHSDDGNETETTASETSSDDNDRSSSPVVVSEVPSSSSSLSSSSWLLQQKANSVFLRHLHPSATVIQSVVRGFVQRRKFQHLRMQHLNEQLRILEQYAATVIQTRVREHQARRLAATLVLQAMGRGWFGRMKLKVLKLQAKLVRIEEERQHDLLRIEARYKRIRRESEKEATDMVELADRRQGSSLEKQTCIMSLLRSENKKMRDDNEPMQQACLLLARKNYASAKITKQIQENLCALKQHVPKFEQDHAKLLQHTEKYLYRVQTFETANQIAQESINVEQKIGRSMLKTIDCMLQHIEKECSDKKLADAIIHLAAEKLQGTWPQARRQKAAAAAAAEAEAEAAAAVVVVADTPPTPSPIAEPPSPQAESIENQVVTNNVSKEEGGSATNNNKNVVPMLPPPPRTPPPKKTRSTSGSSSNMPNAPMTPKSSGSSRKKKLPLLLPPSPKDQVSSSSKSNESSTAKASSSSSASPAARRRRASLSRTAQI